MDDLLREFLTETSEHLDTVDLELVRFEQDPNNEKILGNIFRLVHTIKGTCGFLGLPRLEALAHAAETLMGKFRDGMPVTSAAVTLILATLDRVKEILAELESRAAEPEGSDDDLIGELDRMSAGEIAPPAAPVEAAPPAISEGGRILQVLERPLKPGEVSLDDLERAFRETEAEPAPAQRRQPRLRPRRPSRRLPPPSQRGAQRVRRRPPRPRRARARARTAASRSRPSASTSIRSST